MLFNHNWPNFQILLTLGGRIEDPNEQEYEGDSDADTFPDNGFALYEPPGDY